MPDKLDCVIRNAKLEDHRDAARIMTQVHQLHLAWRPDVYRTCETAMPFARFAKGVAEHTFFVAEADGRIVGIMELKPQHIHSPLLVAKSILSIETLAVDSSFRGRGVGHRFLDKAKEIQKELAFDGLELSVNGKNKAAYDMYASYGFTEKIIKMELLS